MNHFARVVLVAVFVAIAGISHAQHAPRRQDASGGGSLLSLETGAGRVIALGRPASSVFAADPKIAEVRPASATSLFIFGVAPGRTTIAALDTAGNPIAQYDVVVHASSFASRETGGAIDHDIPGSNLRAEARTNGISVGGTAATPLEAQRGLATARMYAGDKDKIDSQINMQGPTQVNLHVKIAEMSRNLTRALGIDWQAMGTIGKYGIAAATANFVNPATLTAATATLTGPGKGFESMIDALAQDQLVHVLAQPNLTAASGEAASFIVGGEFPVPVAQNNNTITVEFKQYGISLAFVPTVLDDGQITLKVRPEVSELSDQGAVTLTSGNSTIQIPALSVRRAETTVTLGSGQSFAIAGLLSDQITHAGTGLPLLGDIPVLGALFRSDSFIRQETELVIVVTPYLVRPVSNPAGVQLPTDGYKPPNDFERIVLLRQYGIGSRTNATGATGAAAGLVSVPGSAGFVLQ